MAEDTDGYEPSPIGLVARLKQAGYLALLLLKFKARRLPITIFVLLLMPSNYWLYDAFSRVETATASSSESQSKSKHLINAQTFSKDWQVLVDTKSAPQAAANLKQIMLNSGASANLDWLVTCNSRDDCMLKYFRQLYGSSERRLFGRISYSNDSLHLECLETPDMNIPGSSVCAFLYQLMIQSLSNVSESRAGFFKDVEFVEYLGIGGSPRDVFIRNIMNRTLSDTMCSRSLLNSNFLPALWMTILLHILITTAGVMVHFAATTVTFILGLKENGFLQLMFNSGLSVASYWSVMLTTTVLESIIFGSLFALCYGLQCPDYFPTGAAVRLLMIFAVFTYCQGALSLMATVLFESYLVVVIAISAETLLIVAMSAIGVLKLNQEQSKVDIALHGMLVFPPGNIAQYSMYILTPENLSPWSGENKTYLNLIPTVMAIFAGTITLFMTYLDFLLPSGNGNLLPPTFVFSRGFWLPGRLDTVPMEEDEATEKTPNIEQVVNGVPAILVRGISKSYGCRGSRRCCPTGCCSRATQALKSVSCIVYQNQITALIGHNGAGKTTLMRVLTGEEAPTRGLAIIGGRMVTDPYQRLTLRRQVSICKQENVLSPHLTLAESLQLAVISKGLTMASQQATIDDMLRRLGLTGKENVRAVDMSGGQLRKLCCIITLLGNPPVVMLDEPTSGLDPVSRRRLWQILQEHKQGRCIILCTQFMDEADVLADRKLFLSSGQLVCAGSSLFLKHLFGCSAVINVSLRSENDAETVLRALGPDVQLISETKTELQLGLELSDEPELKVLMRAVQVLERDTVRVAAFGISQANLDDIFIRLESIDPASLDSALNTRRLNKMMLSSVNVVANRHPSLVGESLRLSALQPSVHGTFANLLIMNLRRQIRAPVQFLCRFFMPVAIIAFLAVLVHMERNKYASNKETVRLLRETDDLMSSRELIVKLQSLLSSEIVKVPVQPWAYRGQLRAICIADQGITPGDCASITGHRFSVNPMVKPSSVSLGNYLNQSMSTNAVLQKMCHSSCPFVYSNNWDPSQPNSDRSVVIGRYGMYISNRKEQLPSYDVSRSLLEYFGAAKSLTRRVRLSVIISLENFQFSQMELLVFLMVYSIIPVTFMTDSVEDKVSRVRQQMYVTGLSSKAYWINIFLIHYIQYVVFALFAMVVCLQWEKYRSLLLLTAVAVPMLVAGTTSNILTVYCIGSLQQTTNNSVMTGYFFFVMIFSIMSMFVCKSRLAIAICTWLVPPMTPVLLCVSAVKLFTFAMLYFECDHTGDVPGLWTAFIRYPDMRHALAAFPVHIALQLVFLHIAETWDQPAPWLLSLQLRLGLTKRRDELHPPPPHEEVGVTEERSRVEQKPRSDSNALEVRRLEKVHPNGNKAVRDITFGAAPGEIFGLLGQNGAGKTTTMSVIVGETSASSGEVEVRHGDAWIASVDGSKHGAVGYCPQHNPLFDSVTVEEHMLFYAQIRSLTPDMAAVQCYSLIDGLGLAKHQHKPAGHLSGGNKRRLCLALALLGSPSIVVIDEASSGVDPENKRAIWSAIRGMVTDGRRTVVVTTHSMEEVEALCNRVAIMNKGVMIGFGTVQQLRSRHGNAFILEALVSAFGDLASLAQRKLKLKAAVLHRFQDAQVVEDVCASVQFQVPTESIPRLSSGIQWLVDHQASLEVEYFSLHQMSLDQVFVNMMRQQALEQGELVDKL